MTQKGFDLDHIKLIWNLNKGEINFEEYLRRRGLSKNEKLGELKYLVNDNHYMLNEFLSNISIGLRCKAMKGLFNLTDSDIEYCIDFKKSSIGYFISENMTINKAIVSQRNTSLELVNDLAIIFDLPFRYLALSYTKYEMLSSFAEYDAPNIKLKTLQELIEEILFEMKNGDKNKRNIFGVRIKNNFFVAGRNPELFTRVDIRKDFFTIEIHLENEANINSSELLNLENSIGIKHEIYIRNAFLRDNKKLYILIPLEGTLKPNIIYLKEEFLWENVLYHLNKETMKKIEENEENESKVNFN